MTTTHITTLSLVTATIIGLTGCGGDGGSSKTTADKSTASELITQNSTVELDNPTKMKAVVETALENNTKAFQANLLNEADAKEESKKFTSSALSDLNLDELDEAIAVECDDADEGCKEEAYSSTVIALEIDKEMAYAMAQEVRDNDKEEAYAMVINDQLVKEKFSCDAGETKTVQHYGIEDNFSSANGAEEANASNQVRTNPGIISYNNGIGLSNYDTTQVNRLFAEEIKNLPSGITKGMFYIGLENHGSNDRITIGNMDQDTNTNDYFGEDVLDLDSSLGWNKNTHVYSQSFANIAFKDGSNLKNYVQNHTNFDVYIQDDTYVDFITVATCSKPDPIKEIKKIVNEFECNEKEGEIFKISGGEIDAFAQPNDVNTPSSTLLAVNNYPKKTYDDPAYDKHFIDTLNLNLSSSQVVTKAEFNIGFKSTNRSLWTNDVIYLGEMNVNHVSGHLYETLANIWDANNAKAPISGYGYLIKTDLKDLNNTVGTGNVFDTLNTKNELDVYVQDDTTVDFTQLNLCVKDNCDENAKTHKIDLSQLASWTTQATDAVQHTVQQNPLPTVWDNSMKWIEFTSKEVNGNRVLEIPFCACSNTVVNLKSLKADNSAVVTLDGNNTVATQNASGQASMRADNNGGVHASGTVTLPAGTNGGTNHTLKVEVKNQSSWFGVAIDGTLNFKGNLGKCTK